MAMADSEQLQGHFERRKRPVMLGSEVFVSRVKQRFFERRYLNCFDLLRNGYEFSRKLARPLE
jgi:hypothetical protein